MSPQETAKTRELHLRRAESLAQEADLLELEASAKIRANDEWTARRGAFAACEAVDLRLLAQRHLCRVTDLTDYSFPSDQAASGFRSRLESLALDTLKGLTPGEIKTQMNRADKERQAEKARLAA
jgi:hypothetical protein